MVDMRPNLDSELPRFTYSLLDDPSHTIRLLQILCHDPLQCQMSVHRLNEAPVYRAISYTWGEASPLQSFVLDGCRFLSARLNCVYALTQAHQNVPEKTPLWIDAVCINQEDNEEKSCQVAIMGRIYRRAESVFVSLGAAYDDSELLYEAAPELKALQDRMIEAPRGSCERCEHLSWLSRSKGGFWKYETHAQHAWAESLHEEKFRRLKAAYLSFIGRPYWRRVWIMQEIVLARQVNVACGQQIDTLQNLRRLNTVFKDRNVNGHDDWSYDDAFPPPTCDFMIRRPDHFSFACERVPSECGKDESEGDDEGFGNSSDDEYEDEGHSILNFLPQLPELQCANVRDRIYGLLGMIDFGSRNPLRPDYNIHPFHLALDIIARIGRPKVPWADFTFPYHVSDVLRAMEIGINAEGLALSGTFLPELLPIDWDERSGAYECDDRPEKCLCQQPTSPNIAILSHVNQSAWRCVSLQAPDRAITPGSPVDLAFEFRTGSVSNEGIRKAFQAETRRILSNPLVKEGDILFRFSDGPHEQRKPELRSKYMCLILRQRQDQYYEISDNVIEVHADFFVRSRRELANLREMRELGDLWMSLDARDAAVIVLAHQERLARAANAVTPELTAATVLDKRFCSLPMSSFALRMPDAEPYASPRPPPEVARVPSADGIRTICARCGGLSAPEGTASLNAR